RRVGAGRVGEQDRWPERAGQPLRTEADPATGMGLHYSRGLLDLALGRYEAALADFQAGERLAPTLVTPNILATPIRAHMLQTRLRLGQTERVEAALAGLDEHERGDPEMCATLASLRLAPHDPPAATAAPAPGIGRPARGHAV